MSNDQQYGGDSAAKGPDKGPDGGRQTAQQAAITGQGGAGKTDVERKAGWRDADGEPGRSPVAVGGSSQGQSDQNDGRSVDGGKVAGGLYQSERTGGDAPSR